MEAKAFLPSLSHTLFVQCYYSLSHWRPQQQQDGGPTV